MQPKAYLIIATIGLLWLLAYSILGVLACSYYCFDTLYKLSIFIVLAIAALALMRLKYKPVFYINLALGFAFLFFILLEIFSYWSLTGIFAELLYYFVLCPLVFNCAEPAAERFVFWQISMPLSYLLAFVPVILVIIGTWKSKPIFFETKEKGF